MTKWSKLSGGNFVNIFRRGTDECRVDVSVLKFMVFKIKHLRFSYFKWKFIISLRHTACNLAVNIGL